MSLPGSALLPGFLLAADALALVLLVPLVPLLAPLGAAGPWLEAALRLPLLALTSWLLSPRCPRGAATAAVVTVTVTPAVFGTFRNLLGSPGSSPALLVASGPAWLAVTHGATALAMLAWAPWGVPKTPGDVAEAASDVTEASSDVPKTSSDVSKAGDVPKAPGDVPKAPGDVPKAPGDVPKTSSDVSKAGDVPKAPGGVPKTSSDVPKAGDVPKASSGVPKAPGDVPKAPGDVPKALSGVPKASGDVWHALVLTWQERKVLGAALLCLVLAAVGETSAPYVTGKVLDAIGSGDGLSTGALGMVAAAGAASVLFSGCRGWCFLLLQARLRQSLSLRLFSHLVRQDLDFFQGVPAAELLAQFSLEVPRVCAAAPTAANHLLRSLAMSLVVGSFMVGLAPRLALLALLELPLGIAFHRVQSARRRALQQSLVEASARTAAGVQESVAAIDTIRIFSAEEEEEERHGQNLAKELRLKERMELELAFFTLIHRMVQLSIRALVLFRSHQLLRDKSITAGALVTFLLYQDTVGSHVQVLLYGFNQFLTNAAAGRKIWEYLGREPSRDLGGTREPPRLQGHVTFQKVSFAYPGNPEHPVLKDVTFEVRSGEVTALTGPNGSGKSTAVALLERLREPGSGEVLLDGIPLHEYEHQYLHRKVVLVEQDPVLFSGTIRENVALGLEKCKESELREAASAAGALEFIQGLEKGWDTEVGERGARLAAGERRCLALARALLRRPAVLILDEALDDGDAGAAQRWLRSGLAQAVLVVSHRPRVLEAADRLVLLERGAVAETGTPAELRERRGAYARLLLAGSGTEGQETPGVGSS